MSRPLLLFFFLLSGAAALAYEVVWIRLLSLTLSITIYSLTTVLCAFMAGLGIGSAISARIADRIERPLFGFALLEFGIAVCGLSLPWVLTHLSPAYLWLHATLGGEGAFFAGSRFVLAFAVLLPPTTLMGITLPLLSRAVVDREDSVGRGTGWLYAANTFGAVAGCIGAGFLLIPQLGLTMTSAIAAALNVTVGVLALTLGRNHRVAVRRPSAEHGSAPDASPLPLLVILAALAFGLSGFTAMGYEVLWTRALEHYTHNSTYAYSAMLATFLAGLASGSALMTLFADRMRRPALGVALLQLGIGITVVVALVVYRGFETWIPALVERSGGLTSWFRAVVMIFFEAGATMFATTLLFGAMFPLVSRIVVESLDSVGRRVAVVYLVNTIGSILGSLLVGFFLLPQLGLRDAFLVLISINLATGLLLAAQSARRNAVQVGVVGVLVLVAGVSLVPPQLFEEQFRERYGILRFYREEITDTVMVTEDTDGSRAIRYADGRGTAGTLTVLGDRSYGHLPLLLHPLPRKILQIAFGVGNSLSSVLQHPVDSVDCVELSPGVIDSAQYFRSTNRDSINDPRVTLHINDGRNYLLTSREKFDIIRLDPPELHTAGVVNLYTREFYQLARDHLAEGGIFSIWVNIVMTPKDGMRSLIGTVLDVFPHVTVWHDPGKYSWIINGSLEPRPPDMKLLQRHFADASVRSDLESVDMAGPYRLLSHFVFAEDGAARFAGDAPLVIDDHTRLDFTVPRSRESLFGTGNSNNSNWLAQQLEPGAQHDVATRIFFQRVREMRAYKESVVPHLRGVEGLDPSEIERRIEQAAELPRERRALLDALAEAKRGDEGA